MRTTHSDSVFLQEPHHYVGTPLAVYGSALSRVAFAPGAGLGLGDQFMCLPLVRCLCEVYPNATVDLYTDYPEFWSTFRQPRVRVCPGDAPAVIAATRNAAYNVVITGYFSECLDAFRGAHVPTVFCAGTDLEEFRAFYVDDGRCREIMLTRTRTRYGEARRFTGLFEDFGLRAASLAPRRSTIGLPRVSGLHGARVLLHPSAAKSYKCWPEPCWRALAQLLAGRGAQVLVSRGVTPEEAQAAASVAERIRGVELLPKLTLAQCMDLIAQCDVVVSVDTFLPHAAHWVEGPLSYALYGPTDPLRFCPWGARHYFGSIGHTPSGIAHTIEALLHTYAFGSAAVASGDPNTLTLAARSLVNHVTNWTREPSPEMQRNAYWRECAETFRNAIQPEYRDILAGSPELQQRISQFIAYKRLPMFLDVLQASPAFRSAMLLAERAQYCEPIRSAAG